MNTIRKTEDRIQAVMKRASKYMCVGGEDVFMA